MIFLSVNICICTNTDISYIFEPKLNILNNKKNELKKYKIFSL